MQSVSAGPTFSQICDLLESSKGDDSKRLVKAFLKEKTPREDLLAVLRLLCSDLDGRVYNMRKAGLSKLLCLALDLQPHTDDAKALKGAKDLANVAYNILQSRKRCSVSQREKNLARDVDELLVQLVKRVPRG